MKIPFVNLKIQYESIKDSVDKSIKNVIDESAFIGGKYVKNFETEFSKLYDFSNCVSVANGTDSLFIILKMLGIGKNDEVITVANSWIATSEAITLTGAKPIFVDVDAYYTIDVNKIESKISNRTKAIIPVHLYGQSCDMDIIIEIAKKYNLHIVEDCAQAHFSEYNGKKLGTFGIANSFSFYPGKNLGAYGDAGCILSSSFEFAQKCRKYANHGALVKHNHDIEGLNSRLDGLQAAILSAKLPYILDWTDNRITNAAYYNNLLSSIEGVEIPLARVNSKHTYHLYVIKTLYRDQLAAYLKKYGIETVIHYPTPLPFLKAYKYLELNEKDFPNVLENQKKILSLPLYPELSFDEIDYIVTTIKNFFNSILK